MVLSVPCGVSFCTVSPSVCLDDIYLSLVSCLFGQPYVLFVMSICNFVVSHFGFKADFGSDCVSSWTLLTFYFFILAVKDYEGCNLSS